MKKVVFKHNRKQHIVAIATGFFAALPIICLPIGLREGLSPSLVVSRAYQSVFGVQKIDSGEVELEDWALVDSADDLVSADAVDPTESAEPGATTNPDTTEPGEPDGTEPGEPGAEPDSTEKKEACGTSSYSDIPKFVIYQQYDDSNLPIELLDPSCFKEDNSTYYVRANQSILKETPDMDSKTLVSLHVGQQVTRTGVGDTWSRIKTEAGKEGFVLTNSIQDTMVSVKVDRTVWVDTGSLIVRAEPSTSSQQIAVINQDARLHATAIVGDKWYKVTTTSGKTGYVYKSYTTTSAPPTPTPTPTPKPKPKSSSNSSSGTKYGNTKKLPKISGKNGDSIVSIAESMLGVKYKFGGCSSKGIDCSGLVKYCYAQVGVSVPHGATQIWKKSGVSVPRSEIKKGDVITDLLIGGMDEPSVIRSVSGYMAAIAPLETGNEIVIRVFRSTLTASVSSFLKPCTRRTVS